MGGAPGRERPHLFSGRRGCQGRLKPQQQLREACCAGWHRCRITGVAPEGRHPEAGHATLATCDIAGRPKDLWQASARRARRRAFPAAHGSAEDGRASSGRRARMLYSESENSACDPAGLISHGGNGGNGGTPRTSEFLRYLRSLCVRPFFFRIWYHTEETEVTEELNA